MSRLPTNFVSHDNLLAGGINATGFLEQMLGHWSFACCLQLGVCVWVCLCLRTDKPSSKKWRVAAWVEGMRFDQDNRSFHRSNPLPKPPTGIVVKSGRQREVHKSCSIGSCLEFYCALRVACIQGCIWSQSYWNKWKIIETNGGLRHGLKV